MPELHRVKLATTVLVGRCRFYVWECACGHSSRLHQTKAQANYAYSVHKAGEDGELSAADLMHGVFATAKGGQEG